MYISLFSAVSMCIVPYLASVEKVTYLLVAYLFLRVEKKEEKRQNKGAETLWVVE